MRCIFVIQFDDDDDDMVKMSNATTMMSDSNEVCEAKGMSNASVHEMGLHKNRTRKKKKKRKESKEKKKEEKKYRFIYIDEGESCLRVSELPPLNIQR